MLAHIGCIVDGDTVGAAKVKNGKLAIRLVLDLGMIARDAFVFDYDVIAELTANIDDGFFNLVVLLASLR